jgi:hypothetical protein
MTAKLIDLTGRKFGRWRVLAISTRRDRSGHTLWRSRCDCGSEGFVRGDNLRRGGSTNCGCVGREKLIKRNTKHGLSNTRVYHCWENLLKRCLDPGHNSFPNYGGREPPVTVCERWRSFENFYADVGDPPPGKSLDRYPDRNGNYEPGNWRWATGKEQALNRRPRKRKRRRADISDIRAYAASLARAASAAGGVRGAP